MPRPTEKKKEGMEGEMKGRMKGREKRGLQGSDSEVLAHCFIK